MFQPINDKILVELVEKEAQTKGGLFLPDATKEIQNKGKVVAVGSGIEDKNGFLRELPVAVGDTVVYNVTAGVDLEEDGKKCKVISIRDVLGVIR